MSRIPPAFGENLSKKEYLIARVLFDFLTTPLVSVVIKVIMTVLKY